MDNMHIKKGGLLDTTIISPFVKRLIKKNVGIKVNTKIGFDQTMTEDGRVSVHIDVDANMTKEEFETLKSFIERM